MSEYTKEQLEELELKDEQAAFRFAQVVCIVICACALLLAILF